MAAMTKSFPRAPARLRGALARARGVLLRESRLAAAYLYGSALKGPGNRDVDVALLYRPAGRGPSPRALSELALRLDKAFGAETDLHLLSELPDPVRFRVVRDGVRILARDSLFAVRFEAGTMSRFLDFRPTYAFHTARVLGRA